MKRLMAAAVAAAALSLAGAGSASAATTCSFDVSGPGTFQVTPLIYIWGPPSIAGSIDLSGSGTCGPVTLSASYEYSSSLAGNKKCGSALSLSGTMTIAGRSRAVTVHLQTGGVFPQSVSISNGGNAVATAGRNCDAQSFSSYTTSVRMIGAVASTA